MVTQCSASAGAVYTRCFFALFHINKFTKTQLRHNFFFTQHMTLTSCQNACFKTLSIALNISRQKFKPRIRVFVSENTQFPKVQQSASGKKCASWRENVVSCDYYVIIMWLVCNYCVIIMLLLWYWYAIIVWVLCAYCVVSVWLLCDYDVSIVLVLCAYCVVIVWLLCNYYVIIVWVLCEFCVIIVWLVCDYCVSSVGVLY